MDRRYVGDNTYIATREGWAYLATVIDLSSRQVVGWALAEHMRTELAPTRPRWPWSTAARHRD
jgi:putative transposase